MTWKFNNQSPEINHIYRCQHCGNTEDFIGYAVDKTRDENELVQPFTNMGDGLTPEYELWTGGDTDSEIGDFHSIKCNRCSEIIWSESWRSLPIVVLRII